MPLSALPFDEALQAKWLRGMAEHRGYGGDESVGDPLEELFEQSLDSELYMRELERRGVSIPVSIRAAPKATAEWLQRLLGR